jgi:bifunctional DNA-binding transcriptional regulator/antitoxin component of YhaV-PrlF toxin-antitoxin module
VAIDERELKKVHDMAKQPKKVKLVSISSKRQLSIPKEFYDELGLGKEILLELFNNQLVIKPLREDIEDFSEEILSDLLREGYEGDELMEEFKRRKAAIRPAVESLIMEAKLTAEAVDDIADLFGDDDE